MAWLSIPSRLPSAHPRHTSLCVRASTRSSVIVPAGYTATGAPVGLTYLGRAWSEPTLIRLAHAFERGTGHRRSPPNIA